LKSELFGLSVREMFNRIARRYDLLNHLLSGSQDILWRRFCVRRFPKRLERSLDIATGTGDLAFEIKRCYPGSLVIGLDFVPLMVIEKLSEKK